MPLLRESQNQRPISARNGNHETANDIHSFIRKISGFNAYQQATWRHLVGAAKCTTKQYTQG
jgi:hypothetical protein